jgi:hypothetical protein
MEPQRAELRLRLLPHAEEALATRGLSMTWVERTIVTPDWTDVDPRYPDRCRSYKAIQECGDRILRVVHWREAADIVVLTVYLDRNALKARRP